MEGAMKKKVQKMEQAARRKAALQDDSVIWLKPSVRIGNKKAEANKKACRVKISHHNQ
jgi:hypothetical protein